MATKIEWTDETWNPVTGCTKVSPGCDHCYAERVTERFHGKGSFEQVVLHPDRLDAPLRWRRPRRVFVNSMSDLFHDDVPDEYIARVFAVMGLARRHTFQILTKRHGRMRALLNQTDFQEAIAEHGSDLIGDQPWRQVEVADWTPTPTGDGDTLWSPPRPLPNVWLGVSVEDQKWADIRIPALLDTPAAVRFLSCEPLLGPIDLIGDLCQTCLSDMEAPMCETCDARWWTRRLDWVIAGGESGLAARPMHPDWARTLRDQCAEEAIPFFFKQWGGRTPKAGGRELDGRTWDQYPDTLAVTA